MIRNLKERIKDNKSPFFVRCFIKLGSLVFFMITASASSYLQVLVVMEYTLKRLLISFLETSFVNLNESAERYATLISIPYCFRTLYDIYQYRDLPKTDVFENRTEAYVRFVSELFHLRLWKGLNDCGS